MKSQPYGTGDTSFQAAGGVDGLRQLIDNFFDRMGSDERDQWLTCMKESVEEQPFAADFKKYLMEQLYVPAEAVRRRCEDIQERVG